MADRRFFGRAWASLGSTRNVFGKLCLLALLQLVPVVGQIVTFGYFLGWLREAAWGMETPMLLTCSRAAIATSGRVAPRPG